MIVSERNTCSSGHSVRQTRKTTHFSRPDKHAERIQNTSHRSMRHLSKKQTLDFPIFPLFPVEEPESCRTVPLNVKLNGKSVVMKINTKLARMIILLSRVIKPSVIG